MASVDDYMDQFDRVPLLLRPRVALHGAAAAGTVVAVCEAMRVLYDAALLVCAHCGDNGPWEAYGSELAFCDGCQL